MLIDLLNSIWFWTAMVVSMIHLISLNIFPGTQFISTSIYWRLLWANTWSVLCDKRELPRENESGLPSVMQIKFCFRSQFLCRSGNILHKCNPFMRDQQPPKSEKSKWYPCQNNMEGKRDIVQNWSLNGRVTKQGETGLWDRKKRIGVLAHSL